MAKTKIKPLQAYRERVEILDQLLLPHEQQYVAVSDEKETAAAIAEMRLRGAPLIGITAAYGFYLGAWKRIKEGKRITPATLNSIKKTLDKSRPTAVNLSWATSLMLESGLRFLENDKDPMSLLLHLFSQAEQIHSDDAERCEKMAAKGAAFIEKNVRRNRYRILTHCNTGALATGGIGTALGVIRNLAGKDKVEQVYADETRPYLQGARLTAYELKKDRIPSTLVVDSMAGYLMSQGMIDLVIVGADRITGRGDVANKIGTYSLSVLAQAHNIPFFVAAPESTVDNSIKHGSEIEIEQRKPAEVLECGGRQVAPKIQVLNYSFDVTPRENISAIFTEERIIDT